MYFKYNNNQMQFIVKAYVHCTVPQNFNLLPFLYFPFVRGTMFFTTGKYAFSCIFKIKLNLIIITLI